MQKENMDGKIYFKSNMNIYWSGIALIVISVILSALFIIKDLKNFSFEFFFLLMIPIWIGVLSINNFETERVKKALREYLNNFFPEKLREYDEKPVELLNSDSEDVLDLFKDHDLIQDPFITKLNNEAKSITKFMYSVFLGLPVLLFSTVFLLLKW